MNRSDSSLNPVCMTAGSLVVSTAKRGLRDRPTDDRKLPNRQGWDGGRQNSVPGPGKEGSGSPLGLSALFSKASSRGFWSWTSLAANLSSPVPD